MGTVGEMGEMGEMGEEEKQGVVMVVGEGVMGEEVEVMGVGETKRAWKKMRKEEGTKRRR